MFDELVNRYHNRDVGGRQLLIEVHGRLGEEADLDGAFELEREHPALWARVYVYRDHEMQPGDPLAEPCTLCHELGHCRSWTLNERPTG